LRLALARTTGALALLLIAVVGFASRADAALVSEFTLSPATALPNMVVTAEAEWTASKSASTHLRFDLPAELKATWASASFSGGAACDVSTLPTRADCLWTSPTATDEVTMQATFAVPATTLPGTYTLTSSSDPADPGGMATVVLTIPGSTPTTTTPTTTSTATPKPTPATLTTTPATSRTTTPPTGTITPATTADPTPEPTSSVVPTGVPAGERPSDGPASWPVMVAVALVGIGGAMGVWASGRRKGRVQG
jgi:hypothetical protein